MRPAAPAHTPRYRSPAYTIHSVSSPFRDGSAIRTTAASSHVRSGGSAAPLLVDPERRRGQAAAADAARAEVAQRGLISRPLLVSSTRPEMQRTASCPLLFGAQDDVLERPAVVRERRNPNAQWTQIGRAHV